VPGLCRVVGRRSHPNNFISEPDKFLERDRITRAADVNQIPFHHALSYSAIRGGSMAPGSGPDGYVSVARPKFPRPRLRPASVVKFSTRAGQSTRKKTEPCSLASQSVRRGSPLQFHVHRPKFLRTLGRIHKVSSFSRCQVGPWASTLATGICGAPREESGAVPDHLFSAIDVCRSKPRCDQTTPTFTILVSTKVRGSKIPRQTRISSYSPDRLQSDTTTQSERRS